MDKVRERTLQLNGHISSLYAVVHHALLQLYNIGDNVTILDLNMWICRQQIDRLFYPDWLIDLNNKCKEEIASGMYAVIVNGMGKQCGSYAVKISIEQAIAQIKSVEEELTALTEDERGA